MVDPNIIAGNEFVNENSVNEESMVVDGTMNQESYDFEKGMGEEGEASIHDEEKVAAPEANPDAQADKDAIEAAQTGKPKEEGQAQQPQVNEEFTKVKTEYEKLQRDMAEIQNFFKRDEVRKVLEPIVRGNQQPQAQATVTPAPNVSLDIASFSDEEKADPVSFMNAFGKRAGSLIETRAAEIAGQQVNQAFAKIMEAFEPMIKDYQANKQTAIRNDFIKQYPKEAPTYLNPQTPQYAALKAELEANPNLTIEKAFLIARGKFAGQDAREQADLIVKNREKMAIPSTSGKVQANPVKHFKTSREAAEAAFNQ